MITRRYLRRIYEMIIIKTSKINNKRNEKKKNEAIEK